LDYQEPIVPVQAEGPVIQLNEVHRNLPKTQLWFICCKLLREQGTTKPWQPMDAGAIGGTSEQVSSIPKSTGGAKGKFSGPIRCVTIVGLCSVLHLQLNSQTMYLA
jgi:hypothetical protein